MESNAKLMLKCSIKASETIFHSVLFLVFHLWMTFPLNFQPQWVSSAFRSIKRSQIEEVGVLRTGHSDSTSAGTEDDQVHFCCWLTPAHQSKRFHELKLVLNDSVPSAAAAICNQTLLIRSKSVTLVPLSHKHVERTDGAEVQRSHQITRYKTVIVYVPLTFLSFFFFDILRFQLSWFSDHMFFKNFSMTE